MKKQSNKKKNKSKKSVITTLGFLWCLLRVIFYELISIIVNGITLLIFSLMPEYALVWLIIFVGCTIVALVLAIIQSKKENELLEEKLLYKVIGAYEDAKNEIDQYSNVENEISNNEKLITHKVLRTRERKIAYILKAQVSREIGAVEAISVLGIAISLTADIFPEGIMKCILVTVLLIAMMSLAYTAIILLPKEKYIESVCDKFLSESEEKE